jgi:hypothetical protein
MATEQLNARNRYLAFPFRMNREGVGQSGRQAHIREQITRMLYTQPGERVFLPEWGIGLAQLLFAPMTDAMWRRVEVSLASSLAEALAGEVLADSIQVSVGPAPGDAATLKIVIRYTLAAVNLNEKVEFDITDGVLKLPNSEGGNG